MEAQRQGATIQLNQKAEEFKTLAIEIEPLVAYKLKKLGFVRRILSTRSK